jgi:formylglycine-generating enzyme required for sulfatase activity
VSYLTFLKSHELEDIHSPPTQSQDLTEDLGNGIELKLGYIPAGAAIVGSDEYDDERPIHQVTVDPFAIGIYPITQSQYCGIMGENPANFRGENLPVESVSWFDAMKFCDRLSQLTGHTYTLPSEVQWEYAARAGTNSKYHVGNIITTASANYNGEKLYGDTLPGIFRGRTTEVGSFPANPFGLYDIHGNVWEWCLDEWHGNYDGAPSNELAWLDPDRLHHNIARVKRGGSWNYYACSCRSSFRCSNLAANLANTIGFRVVRILTATS